MMSNGDMIDVVPAPLAGDKPSKEKIPDSNGFKVIGAGSHEGAAPAPYQRLLLPLTLVDPFSM